MMRRRESKNQDREKLDLVDHYSEIGIAAVAAAVEYQSGAKPHHADQDLVTIATVRSMSSKSLLTAALTQQNRTK